MGLHLHPKMFATIVYNGMWILVTPTLITTMIGFILLAASLFHFSSQASLNVYDRCCEDALRSYIIGVGLNPQHYGQ